jgi:hypothetical protein
MQHAPRGTSKLYGFYAIIGCETSTLLRHERKSNTANETARLKTPMKPIKRMQPLLGKAWTTERKYDLLCCTCIYLFICLSSCLSGYGYLCISTSRFMSVALCMHGCVLGQSTNALYAGLVAGRSVCQHSVCLSVPVTLTGKS